MKRIISMILTVCMLATLFVVPMMNVAADDPAPWLIPTTFANTTELYTPDSALPAVKVPAGATITIDGKADDAAWANAAVINFDKAAKTANGYTYSDNLDAEYYVMWDDTNLYILEKRVEPRITVTASNQANFWSNSHKTFYDFCLPTAATAEKPSASVLVGTWVTSADANATGDAYNYCRYNKFAWNADAGETNSAAGRTRETDKKTGIESKFEIVDGGYVIETQIAWATLGLYNADAFTPAANAEFGMSFYFCGRDYNKNFYPNRAGLEENATSLDGGDSRMFGKVKLLDKAPAAPAPEAVAPTGTGTAADPYLISSAANLVWMSEQIGDGSVVQGTQSNPFAGKFFKQTADIDLGGAAIPSIGYYYVKGELRGELVAGAPIKQQDNSYVDANGAITNSQGILLDELGTPQVFNTKYVFGGTYDGQGFTIKNGTVVEPTPANHTFDICYGSGLFGMIYGATIQNVKLDNITATGVGVVGTLVGRAAVDGYSKNPDGTLPTTQVAVDFNKIINCSTSATCSVQATYVNTTNQYDAAGRIGGIAGMTGGTTIRNCVNNATVNAIGGINFAGGIVGVAGQNTAVNKCVNNGMLTLDVTSNANKGESAMGGIVGFNAPYSSGTYKAGALGGGLTITYCYNTGSFTFVGTKNTAPTYWGGILGGGNSSYDLGYTYTIANCFNLCDELNGITGDTNWRIAGILGSYWIADKGPDVGSFFLTDCYSVDVKSQKDVGGYLVINEYICKNRVNKAGLNDIVAAETDDGEYLVDTRTAEEIAPFVALIDAKINANSNDDPDFANPDSDETTADTTAADTTVDTTVDTTAADTTAADTTAAGTTAADTDEDPTEAPTAAPTDDKKPDESKGCASFAGGAAVLLLALAAAPMICRKKED